MISRIIQRADGLWYAQVFFLFGWQDISRAGYGCGIINNYVWLKKYCGCYTEVEAVTSLWNKIQNEKAAIKAVEKEMDKLKPVKTSRIFWSKKAVQNLYGRLHHENG